VPFRNEDVTVRCRDHVGWLAQSLLRAITLDASRANRHQQRAVSAVFECLMAFAVLPLRIGHPDIALRIDVEPVREDKRATAPALDRFARSIEPEDRRLGASRAGVLEAAVHDVDVAVRSLLGTDDRAPLQSCWQLRPVRIAPIRVRPIVNRLRALPFRLLSQ